MAEPIRVEADLAGDEFKHMVLEAGKYAGLADGSVMVGLGDTRVLVTATAARQPRPGSRLLPAHRRHRGADVRRGQDPRLVLPSRGPRR